MPRIPVYNSRVSAPGPIPGLGDDLAAPGRAVARFGAAIVGFGEDLARHDARKAVAESMRQAQAEAARTAADNAAARLDEAHDDALVSVMRADALNQASTDADPEQLTARALAYFDAAAGQLIEGTGDPDQRARRQILVRESRGVLAERAEARRAGHLATILNEKLAAALDGYASALRRDAAMLPAMLRKGADTIAESAHLAGLGPERIAAMSKSWAKRAHVALLEGTIERDPALALALLESGEMDEPLGNDKATIARLKRQAGTALAAAEADRRQRERTQRILFELGKAEHLERIRRTGRGDPETEALAGTLLETAERAAFRDEAAAAEAHYAARRRYAFMTAEEIDADIAAGAPGGGPRDTDERSRDHQARIAARDEILAERSRDPAGWAMQDETVSHAFATAEDAAGTAASPESALSEAEAADRLFRRALALRLQVQADMGETPRLLAEDEKEALAAELQSLPPADRLARIGDLRRRFGGYFDGLAAELAGAVSSDTAILLARARDAMLARMLARGMETDSIAFRGARELWLPVAGGSLDTSRLEDKQSYRFMAGGRAVDVVYDRKADALVPALRESGSNEASGLPGRFVSALHGAGQGIANVAAAIPKSQAFFAAEISRRTLEDMLAIQMGGEPYWVHRDHADKATVYRFQQASPEERSRMLAEQASVFPQDHPFYKFGEAISEFARKTVPTNPEYEDELFQILARSGGELVGFVVIGSALRRAGVPPIVSVAVTGATTQMVAQFEDALDSGATFEEAREAANLGSLVGLAEAVPITRLFDRLDKVTGGTIRRALIEAAKGGAEEALQEAFQTVTAALIASDIVGYDPDRRAFEGLGENAGIGFTLGGLANLIAAIVGGHRSARNRQAPDHSKSADVQGAGFGPEDTGSAPSGTAAAAGDGREAGTIALSDLDAPTSRTPSNGARRARFYENALHENFRDGTAQTAGAGQAGHNAFGFIDPASGKPIIQPVNDADRMLAMANESAGPLEAQLRDLVADLPRVEFNGVRAKKPDRLGEKLAGGRRPDTIGDYLGGRIVVDDPGMLDEAVRVLAQRYENVEVDDFIDNPRDTGYRAIHMQIILDSGMTAELQIMPDEILAVYEKDHLNYQKWRNKVTFTSEEMAEREADRAWAQKAYAEAYRRWLQRAGGVESSQMDD